MGQKIAWAGMTFLALMVAIYAGGALVTSAWWLISRIAWVPNLLVVEWFILTRTPPVGHVNNWMISTDTRL